MSRVVHLADLTSEQRALVLALIAAAKAAKPEAAPTPDKGSGAAPSKGKSR